MRNQHSFGPITDLHQEYGVFGRFVLTKRGSLIGAVELGGRDPDGLTLEDFRSLSLIARNIYQHVPEEITLTQYYGHFDNARVAFASRKDAVCHLLSERRSAFLNNRNLTSSRIVHYFEILPNEDLSKLNFLAFFKHLALSFKSGQSREIIRNYFSADKAVLCLLEELQRQERELVEVMQSVVGKWESVMDAHIMSLQETWAHMRFLANLDPSLLRFSLEEEVPEEQWDFLLSDGDRSPVIVESMDALKFHGTENVYARIAAVTQFGSNEVSAGMWAATPTSPVRQAHNYILMMRFCPLSKLQRALMFQSKENELERRSVNLMDILRGHDDKSVVEKKASMRAVIAQRARELEEAELVEDRWGMAHSFIVTFDTNPGTLHNTCAALKKSLNQTGFSVCWESADLPDAWKTFLPGGRNFSVRDVPFTSTQFGAASLVFKASEGKPRVADLGGEEAQYVFLSGDGTPFHYAPFIGGKGVLFGVGPIRSGKSFTKNTMAGHFLKYGGLFRAIDIDHGSEPLAGVFGKNGSVFRVEGGNTQGLNPFAASRGVDDMRFVSHLKNLIIQMLQTNDNNQLRSLDLHEQGQLDAAIMATLKLPKDFQRLGTVVNHCPKELQQKLERWVDGGMYGHLFDQEKDAIGSLRQKVAAFNLAGVKDDSVALPLVMSEIFYRMTCTFEDPDLRSLPKWLDVDESHALLKSPYIANYIVRSVRTWGKWKGGLGMWTQSPKEFLDLADWPALRSAASTFFFMADPHMDEDLYRTAFQLTQGECEAIKNLTPKREAYIVQPDLGVSKKIILEVEPEQYVISTSTPHEVDIRQRNIKQYGFEKGIEVTMQELGLVAGVEHLEEAV